jgi:Glycosyl hydrolases related to GH101 family, GH129
MVNRSLLKLIAAWLCMFAFALTCLPAAAQITLDSYDDSVAIDPGTLSVTFVNGTTVPISSPQADLGAAKVTSAEPTSASWTYPGKQLSVDAELDGKQLTLHFTSHKPGQITWPVIPADDAIKAYILPKYEGIYAPTADSEWMDQLIASSPMDTTAELSMPFVGLDLDGKTLTYIFGNMFDNQLVFERGDAGVSSSVTHTFMPNWDTWEYTVVVELGDGSPIRPALIYRDYLIERGEFVTMAQKIKANPRAERLLGAPHAYLWDAGLFNSLDATDWKGFCAKLIEEGGATSGGDTLGKRIWDSFDQEARDAAVEVTQIKWPYKYIKGVIASQVSSCLVQQIEADTSDDPRKADPRTAVLGAFTDHFAGLVRDYDTWGDGISTKMLDKLRAAGLDRMNLCLGGLSDADMKPQVATYADELGYLFGPYDSYHSVHRPDANPDDTWETAQFGWELYNTGGIVNADGSMSAGFKKVGYHVSPIAARPYVEKRVNEYMSRLRLSAVFVDCDAYGQFFDDYSPDHPATKQQDMLERLDRMSWLTKEHGLIVGSEGGSGYAAPVIHFAHGMFTPVIGWGDPDFKDKASSYYMGAYWPPDGPTTFTLQVPLKPKYKKFYYDPAYRLPLYQAVFHDSVIATHHWGNASLKFKDQVPTVALLEQLYNVPPLYHLNHTEFKKHKKHILRHYAFFSPLHRELALQPMTGFNWLADDRLIQQTTFADGTRIIANFGEQPTTIEGHDLPARSAIAIRPDAEVTSYTPE